MSAWLYIVTQPVYLLACVLVGIAGRKRRTGIFGYFILSFLLTPLMMLFVLFVGGEKPDTEGAEGAADRSLAKKEAARRG